MCIDTLSILDNAKPKSDACWKTVILRINEASIQKTLIRSGETLSKYYLRMQDDKSWPNRP
jgi:hypothetical protein